MNKNLEIYNQLEKDVKSIVYDALVGFFGEDKRDIIKNKLDKITYLFKSSPLDMYEEFRRLRIINLASKHKITNINESPEIFDQIMEDEKVKYYQQQIDTIKSLSNNGDEVDYDKSKKQLVEKYNNIIFDSITKAYDIKILDNKKEKIKQVLFAESEDDMLAQLDVALEDFYGEDFLFLIDENKYDVLLDFIKEMYGKFKTEIKDLYKQHPQYQILEQKLELSSLYYYDRDKYKEDVLNSFISEDKKAWTQFHKSGKNFVFLSGDQDINLYFVDLIHETLHALNQKQKTSDGILIGFHKYAGGEIENKYFDECVIEYFTQKIFANNKDSDIFADREFSDYDVMIHIILPLLKSETEVLKEYLLKDDNTKLDDLYKYFGKEDFKKMSKRLDSFYEFYTTTSDRIQDLVDEIVSDQKYEVINEIGLSQIDNPHVRKFLKDILDIRSSANDLIKKHEKE